MIMSHTAPWVQPCGRGLCAVQKHENFTPGGAGAKFFFNLIVISLGGRAKKGGGWTEKTRLEL